MSILSHNASKCHIISSAPAMATIASLANVGLVANKHTKIVAGRGVATSRIGVKHAR
jgi:uncharacterized protein (DUF2345 family)